MATIYLIRHGQASFGAENYDQLSSVGWEQGRVLGRYLARSVEPGLVVGGNMQRHSETVEAIATGFGSGLPSMQVLEGLNEFDHLDVIKGLRPEWADRAAMMRDLADFPKPAKAFQQTFEKAVARWASGDHDQDYIETWQAFRARVLATVDELIELANGADVLVSTSGGPISVTIGDLLDLSNEKVQALNNVMANTGVSRLLYSGGRRSLSVFNNYSHLEVEDPALVTFR